MIFYRVLGHDLVCNSLTCDRLAGLVESLFLLLFLLLALQQKLVGSLASGHKIEMKSNKVEHQKSENSHHECADPRQNNSNQLRPILIVNVGTTNGYVGDEKHGIGKCGEYADKEMPVIALPHTIIEPNAMVVEFIDTAVAGTTVLAIDAAVAITKFAV